MLKHFRRYSFLTWLASLAAPRYARCSIEIVHFNDVYNIQEKPKKAYKGGAARFVTAMQHY